MVAESPTDELSAEKLTEVALRVGRVNYAYLRVAKRSGLSPGDVYDRLDLSGGLRWEGGSAENLFRSVACELIGQRMDPIDCFSEGYLLTMAPTGSFDERSFTGRHLAGCRYCRGEFEEMRPVMAPS